MPQRYDAIIVGLGAMGSAAAYHLARRGRRVLGLDRFHPPHTMGSSHGGTRIIREAYAESPRYVPLVQRAYECWADLEAESGQRLYTPTGGLMLGAPDSPVVTGALASAREHGLPHEQLDAGAIRRRFPAFAPPDDHVAVWEPRAGALDPERCVAAHLDLAARHGAELHFDEPAAKWRPDGEGIAVTTPAGVYHADRAILSAGAWTARFHAKLQLPLRVTRQTVCWFRPAAYPDRVDPAHCPVWVWHLPGGRAAYGFPDFGDGFKAGLHDPVDLVDPDTAPRDVRDEEVTVLRGLLAPRFPHAVGDYLRGQACLYTNTPDGHFLLDRHHRHPQVIVASPCSGHGFKFSAAIGEILADLATDTAPPFDLDLFNLRRLLGGGAK